MRRFIAALTTVAALPVMAQDPGAPRFAIFAPSQLIQTSARAKTVFTELETKGKELEARMKGKVEELQKLEAQLKSPGLSDEGRAKLQDELKIGEVTFKRAQEDSQKEFGAVQQRVYGTFGKEVEPIVEELAKEWKLNVVFQYTEQTSPFFAYTDKTWALGFTNEVAKRYDAKYASGAPVPAAPAAKPAVKPAAPKK